MSCWYVTPVCLQADSPIGKREKGAGKGSDFQALWEQPGPFACPSNCPCRQSPRILRGVDVGVLTSRKGSWRRLTIPERRPVPPCSDHMHKGRGGLESVPQGLALCSFDQQPHSLIPGNICNSQHLRGPKNSDQGTHGLLVYGTELCQFLDGWFLNSSAPVVLKLICFTKPESPEKEFCFVF